MVRDYRELIVWQKAVEFVVAMYRETASFPKEEMYGLTSQMRRAAVSIPSNIAEGQARSTTRDFIHFLYISRGSLKESETQIIISRRLGYLNEQQEADLLGRADELSRLISGLVSSLRNKDQ